MGSISKRTKIIIITTLLLFIIGGVVLCSRNAPPANNGFLIPDLETSYGIRSTKSVKEVSDETLEYALSLSKDQINTLDGSTMSWQNGVGDGYFYNDDIAKTLQMTANYNNVYPEFDNSSEIYLSFNLEYEQGFTNQILDILWENNVTCAFFINIDYAKKRPDIVQQIINNGHTIGFLTPLYSHREETTAAYAEDNSLDIAKKILNFSAFIEDNFDYKPTLVSIKSPYYSDKLIAVINDLGFSVVLPTHTFTDQRYAGKDLLNSLLNTNYGGCIKTMNSYLGAVGGSLDTYIKETKKQYAFAQWSEVK